MTNIGNLSNGDKVIIATKTNNKPSSGVTGGNVQSSTSTKKDATVSSTEADWMQFTVTTTSNGWYLSNSSSQFVGKPTDNTFYLTTTSNCKGVCSVNANGVLCCNSRYLQKNGNYYRMYSNINNSYTPFYVWKVATSYTVNWTINPAIGGALSAITGNSTTVTPNVAYTYGNPAYTIKTGNASVDQSENTFTATPTANCTIQINMVQKTTADITFENMGSPAPATTGYYVGDTYTLPSENDFTCGDKTFVGWSTEKISTPSDKPTTNFYERGASVTLGATNKFYAVFAEGDGSEILTSITGGDWSTGADGDWSTSGTGTYSGNGVKFDGAGDYVLSPDLSSKNYTTLLLKFKSGYNGSKGSILTFYAYDSNNTLLTNEQVTIDPEIVVPDVSYTAQNTVYEVNISASKIIGSVMIKMTSKTSNLGMKYCELFGVSSSYQNYTTKCAETYTITVANNISNGSVSADKSSAVEGATIKLTATPNTGYKLGTWNVKDASNNPVSVNVSGEFTMPASDVTVSATFVSLPKLATPSELSATEIKPTSATLNWKWLENTYAAQLSYYYLYIKKEGDADFPGPITYTNTSCSRTNLEPNTKYIWKVQAISKDKTIVLTSEESTPSSFTTAALPTYTVSFSTGTGNSTQADITETEGGQGITLPAGPDPLCPDWTFAGWAEADVTEPTTEPTLFAEGTNYKPTGDCTLYAVYSQTETTLGEGEELSQTLKYDSWSYTGSTTDKSSYRMFHEGSYVESAPFDLSILTKVVVYGGTFGGDKYNSLTIGDGANVWKTVTVTGSSQTGQNTFTDGEALSGIGKLRITSNSGTVSGTGVRISKIEIYTISSITTTTYNSNPDCTTPEPTKYNVIITPTTNGTVIATPTSAEKGETITLTVTPNDGYILDALTVTDASSTAITVKNNEFKMPASNVTVYATFKQDESGEVESNSTATIVFASDANEEDGSPSVITEQTEIDKVVAQGVEFVSGFADVSKVYPNSVHGLKLGTSKEIGKITIGLNISKKVSKITFKTYRYKEKEATIKFSAGGKEGSTSEFGDYTLTFDEPTTVSQIVISTGQASKGRAYVSQIDIELAEDEAGEGGEDPVVPTPTVNPTATFIFNTADGLEKLGIAYPTTADGTSKKTNIENNTTVISNGVGLTMTSGTTIATRVWLTASGVLDLRVYKGATLTFAVADGFEIIKVDFEGSDLTNLAVDDNPMTGTIWEGNQKTVTFKNLDNVVKINTIAVTVAYTRDVTPREYGTICIPYGSNNYTGAEFYEISWMEMNGATPKGIWLDQVNGALTAGKPYIFKATDAEITLVCNGIAATTPEKGEAGLTGTFEDIPNTNDILEGNYMISGNQFLLCPAGCWLNAYRAYIDAGIIAEHTNKKAEIPGRRRVCLGENVSTGFENVTNGENTTIKVIQNGQLIIIRNGVKYNVQGQKL